MATNFAEIPDDVLGLIIAQFRTDDRTRFYSFAGVCTRFAKAAYSFPYRCLDLTKHPRPQTQSNAPGAPPQSISPQTNFHARFFGPPPTYELHKERATLLAKIDRKLLEEVIVPGGIYVTPNLLQSLKIFPHLKKLSLQTLTRLHSLNFGDYFPELKELEIGEVDLADSISFPMTLEKLVIKAKYEADFGGRRAMVMPTPQNDHIGKNIEKLVNLQFLELGSKFFVETKNLTKLKHVQIAPTPSFHGYGNPMPRHINELHPLGFPSPQPPPLSRVVPPPTGL